MKTSTFVVWSGAAWLALSGTQAATLSLAGGSESNLIGVLQLPLPPPAPSSAPHQLPLAPPAPSSAPHSRGRIWIRAEQGNAFSHMRTRGSSSLVDGHGSARY